MSTAIVPDIGPALRTALLANQTIVNILPVYLDVPTIFTRRPVPAQAPYPMIVVSDDITKTDRDGVHDQRPYITKDVVVYGHNDTADHNREVMDLAAIVFDTFHRKRNAIYVDDGEDWSVTSLTCTGPVSAPTADDEVFVGRLVSVVAELGRAL